MVLDVAAGVAGGAAAVGAAAGGLGDLANSFGLTKPTKAKLVLKDDEYKYKGPLGAPIECMFNPTTYSISRGSNIQRNDSPQEAGGTPHYSGSQPLTVKMNLFFDDFASPAGNVLPKITQLLKWTVPEKPRDPNPRPPMVGFEWGNPQLTGFYGFIVNLSISYTVFRMDGTPVQANVDLTLEGGIDDPPPPPGQNPTSRAIGSNRIRTLTEGETLQALAYRELGKATRWRAIAELNDIDDPMRVEAGMTLIMPTRADAAKQG
jgi:hypothetical protein